MYSPVRGRALVPALRSAITRSESDREHLAIDLARTFGAGQVVLTDSGTSALVLALRCFVGEGGTVALPAYSCVDLAAAAVCARVKVRLYDIDPGTLSPDLESVDRVLDRGVAAVIVAHLYGFPADVPAVAALASGRGVPVIEDAAQGAGGALHGARLGSFGSATALSFGRGKGLTGGSGGALLIRDPDIAASRDSISSLGPIRPGWHDLAVAASLWVFGRPGLYALPSAIPGLKLGEMVYHPAREPGAMSAAAATLIRATMGLASREVAIRRRQAEALTATLESIETLERIREIDGGRSGYLRLPVRALRGRAVLPRLGIVAAYPRPLADEEHLRPWLHAEEPLPTGAAELARTLFTLPVHSRVTPQDVARMGAWLRSRSRSRPHRASLARA